MHSSQSNWPQHRQNDKEDQEAILEQILDIDERYLVHERELRVCFENFLHAYIGNSWLS